MFVLAYFTYFYPFLPTLVKSLLLHFRDRPKFGYGVSAETTQKYGFGLVSVTAKRYGRITVSAET